MSKATFDETRYNNSTAPDFQEVLKRSLKRRNVLKSGSALAALSMMSALTGCSDDDDDNNEPNQKVSPSVPQLGFDSIEGSKTDAIAVAKNYKAQVLAPWGTPLNDNAAEWKSDGSNTPNDALHSVGMHHDGMHFFPLNGETDGLLCINHEYVDQSALHPNGATSTKIMVDGVEIDVRPVDEVLKEIYAHGVTVVRIIKTNGVWDIVKNDPYNKRYTGATEFDLAGPVAGSELAQTKYSPSGMTARGTLNNCGNGATPWGTYLTCEENWPGYFTNFGELTADQQRIGLSATGTRYGWETPAGDEAERIEEFARFNVTPSAQSHLMDYRNEANGHGYIVEIDPYSPTVNAIKRTALGRFRHEGCTYGKVEAGKPIVFYSGHDARFEYIYKFVSAAMWDPADANRTDRYAVGDKYMNDGTLYVARFNEGFTGEWLPLSLNSAKPSGGTLADDFNSLADIILNTAGAAELLEATPMDRPEWGAVDPITGTVFMTLTNNTRRDNSTEGLETNAANPRENNAFGHIIRWDENTDNTFTWDIFVYGSPADGSENKSDLTASNQFASPDGLGFDERGILWIQTDNGADAITEYTNDQVLAVVPSELDNLDTINDKNQSQLRRFLVGPNGCEITGLAYADNYKTFMVNVQHPKNWPYSQDATVITPAGTNIRPRAATVVVEHVDGTPVGEAQLAELKIRCFQLDLKGPLFSQSKGPFFVMAAQGASL